MSAKRGASFFLALKICIWKNFHFPRSLQCVLFVIRLRYNIFISIQRRVANVYNDSARSAALKAFIGHVPPSSSPSSSRDDDTCVWMSAPPSRLVHCIDEDHKRRCDAQQHALLSSRLLNMISGTGGVTVSADVSSVRVMPTIFVIMTHVYHHHHFCAGHFFAAAYCSYVQRQCFAPCVVE